MSQRTIVAVEPRMTEGLAAVKLDKAPVAIDDARVPRPFDLALEEELDWAQDRAVERRGREILDRLVGAHPAIQTALGDALRTPRGEVRPIYFHLMVEEAERLYWETLCSEAGTFLALDDRWPIARIADSEVDRELPTSSFRPPLRLFAVLSALGVDHLPEWEALRVAVTGARARGLEVGLSIASGNRELVDAIREEIDEGLQGVSVEPLPARTSELEEIIQDAKPNVVHFFCHGTVGGGVSALELATANDFDDPANARPLRVNVERLVEMLKSEELWLVALNCCKGGRATANMHSMAHRLVADGGTPAAVGMLEPFDVNDAHEFSSGFYAALFAKVQAAMAALAEGDSAPLEWADLMRPPRRNICERNADDPVNNRQWALPVLYVRREAFRLRKTGAAAPAVSPAMIKEIDYVAGALRNLPADAPEAARTVLLALLEDVPVALRPDRLGNLGSG